MSRETRANARLKWFTFVLCFVALAGSVRAAIDRSPNSTTGAIYKVTPSTLVDGDYDTIHMDVNHNLLVAGSFTPPAPTPATVATILSFTTTASNGTTAVQLVALTNGKYIVPTSLTISNFDTVAHTVDVLSALSFGQSIEHFTLAAGGSFIYDGAAANFSWHTTLSQALAFKIDAGGSAATVTAIGNYILP